MRRAFCAIVLAAIAIVLSPAALLAAQQWVKLTSPNFELYTTAGEKRGREAILHFEKVRSFFLSIGNTPPATAQRTRIIGLSSAKEFAPYGSGKDTISISFSDRERDTVVMAKLDSDSYPSAVFHYVQSLLRHSGRKWPLWLEIGLGELYSTLKPYAGKVQIGELVPGYVRVLQTESWLDLERLTGAGYDSPLYKDPEQRRIFYPQSWLLTHMLMLSDQYRPKFPAFLESLKPGTSHSEAFQKVYGKSMAKVQGELRGYLNGDWFKVLYFDTKLEKGSEDPEVQPASPIEVGLVLVSLLRNLDKEQEAIRLFDKLAQENPTSWEVAEGRGYFALGSGESMEAVRPHFERAIRLGATNARLYYDYAMLLRRNGEEDAALVPLLEKAVQLNPEFLDARFALVLAFFNQGLFGKAVVTLNQVKQVDAERAALMYRILADSYYRLGRKEDAKKAAEQARQYARTPEDIAKTEELQRLLTEAAQAKVEQPSAPASAGEPDKEASENPPQLARNPEPAGKPVPVQIRREPVRRSTSTASIEGTLKHFDCLGAGARLRIVAAGEELALAILDPESVRITGTATGTFDFTCGPQKSRFVLIEFEVKGDAQLGTKGIVRSIEFK